MTGGIPLLIPVNDSREYRANVGARTYHEQNDEQKLVEVEECGLDPGQQASDSTVESPQRAHIEPTESPHGWNGYRKRTIVKTLNVQTSAREVSSLSLWTAYKLKL